MSQWDLRMLLFTRIVSLGYLFNMCISGSVQWTLNVLFSVTLILLTTYSCYLTIRLRGNHDGKLMFY